MNGSPKFSFSAHDLLRVLERALWAGLAAFLLFLVQTGIPEIQTLADNAFEAGLVSLVAGLASALQKWISDTQLPL